MGRKGNNGREKLIDAAFTKFAERGFDQATSREIAEQAGVALGLIHRHFGGKEQLLAATDERYLIWSRTRLSEILPLLWEGRSDDLQPLEEGDTVALNYFRRALMQPRPGSAELVDGWLRHCEEALLTAESRGHLQLSMSAKQCAQLFLTLEVGVLLLHQIKAQDLSDQRQAHLHVLNNILNPTSLRSDAMTDQRNVG